MLRGKTKAEATLYGEAAEAGYEQGNREAVNTPLMDSNIFGDNLDRLKGRVLTIVDASFTDPRQRKAVKDLLRKAFKETRYESYEFFFGKAYVMSIGEEAEAVPEETI